MRSSFLFAVSAFMAVAAHGSADHDFLHARNSKACKPTGASGCSSCGANWVTCGTDACYNPVAGDICCANRYACPSTSNCSTLGIGCIPRNGKARECPKELTHLLSSSSTSSVATSTSTSAITTTSNSGSSSSSATFTSSSSSIPVSTTDSSSSSSSSSASTSGTTSDTPATSSRSSTSDSSVSTTGTTSGPPITSSASTTTSTTSFITTITSTTTSTITVSQTNPQLTGACGATNIPLTTSVAPFGNYSSTSIVALNTTTSTLSVTNVSSTIPGTISVPISVNATKPTGSIVPPINGFKGAADRAGASMFALGSLVLMASLLV